MALTIHYRFKFEGIEANLLEKLNLLSTEFLKLPVTKVHPIEIGRNGYEIPVEVGSGCEWFVVTLGADGANTWSGRSFTKTAYASDLKLCHETVVAMLDLCKETGILESVEDESGYWILRDPKVFGEVEH
jgi:hypothetical protein